MSSLSSTPPVIGAGVLLYTTAADGIDYILFGYEGKYVTDFIQEITDIKGVKYRVDSLQTIRGKATVQEASVSAFNKAKLIEENLNPGITNINKRRFIVHYTQLIEDSTGSSAGGGSSYKTIYTLYDKTNPVDHRGRYQHKKGIPKGKINVGETSLQTAIREVKEELDVDISKAPFNNLITADGYDIFRVKIDPKVASDLMTKFQNLEIRKYGELFDFNFVPLPHILDPKNNYVNRVNYKTKIAIDAFLQYRKINGSAAGFINGTSAVGSSSGTPGGGARKQKRKPSYKNKNKNKSKTKNKSKKIRK